MRRVALAGLGLALFASSCLFRSSPAGAADELAKTAASVETATYAAVYRFGFVRQFAPGISTRLEITQEPPVTVRKIDTTTRPEEGKPVTLTAWYVKNLQGNFACNKYDVGVRCQKDPVATGTFASEKLNEFFDLPKESNAFASVRKASRPQRFRGKQGTCFEAVPATPSPGPSPEPTPERFRYELCYAEDGVLLQGRRTTLDEGASAEQSESFVELVSISGVVEPSELKLPGPVIEPDEVTR